MKKKHLISIVIVALLFVAYFIADSILFDGVQPRVVNHNEVQATFFTKKGIKNQPAIIIIGGGHGGDYWGQEFAKANYVGVSLPYYRHERLPPLMEEIQLEYFEKAMNWLKEQPEVNPNKIIVMGASRNAELALVLASYYPDLVHGVIAYSPSSVSWSNTVLPFNSDEMKPSWTVKNKPVPYIPMEKIKGGTSETIETLSYWQNALLDTTAVDKASIKVENINGPILLLSGVDDEVWPATIMSDMIIRRLKNNAFKFEFEHIKYENAGHLISGNPNNPSTMRQGTMVVNGKNYQFNFGGTAAGDRTAQQDASKRVFNFLNKLKNE